MFPKLYLPTVIISDYLPPTFHFNSDLLWPYWVDPVSKTDTYWKFCFSLFFTYHLYIGTIDMWYHGTFHVPKSMNSDRDENLFETQPMYIFDGWRTPRLLTFTHRHSIAITTRLKLVILMLVNRIIFKCIWQWYLLFSLKI